MNFLVHTLILSAISASNEDTFVAAINTINSGKPSQTLTDFKSLVNEKCDAAYGSWTDTVLDDAPFMKDLNDKRPLIEKALNELQWVKKSADAVPKELLTAELLKEVNCQKNLAAVYFEISRRKLFDVAKATIQGSDTQKFVNASAEVKEFLMQKQVKWLASEFEKSRAIMQKDQPGTILIKKSFTQVFKDSPLQTLWKPVFDEVMNSQKNELSKDILDAIFKKTNPVTNLAARPKTDLVVLVDVAAGTNLQSVYKGAADYTTVLLREFKNILEAANKSTYDTAIVAAEAAFAAANFSHLDVNWINALLASMKSAHVKLINVQLSDVTKYLVDHRTLIKAGTGVEGQYYLSQVLIEAKKAPGSGDTTKKFVNRASELKFKKRRDDFLYNTYMDLKLEKKKELKELKELKDAAFYEPSKWTSLDLALLKPSAGDKFNFFRGELHHEDQKVKYGSGIINIPVEFDITTFKPAAASVAASAATTSEVAFQHFNTVMDKLRQNTCINFFRVTEVSHLQKLKNADRQYIKLARALPTERGCDEIIGKKPIKGKADIPTLQPFSELCLKGNKKKLPTGIAHYFMHHLGFDNEHQRHDADTFVKHPEDLDLPMINSRPAHNTKFDEGNNASSLTGEYDITSVMQWSQKWTKSQENIEEPSHMRAGEVSLFSTKDFAKINNLYGCGSKSLVEKNNCDELITQSTSTRVIDYNNRVQCLEKKNAKANIYFQQPEFVKISSTKVSAYKIKATVTYKTIIKKVRRLAKVWSSNMEIASGDAELYINKSSGFCGGARINIESNENLFICTIEASQPAQSELIESKCGEPMKVQYEVIGDYVNENAITSVLKIDSVKYEACDRAVPSLIGKDSSSGSIFKLFTLVTIFLI